MKQKTTIISQADLARELHATPSTIARFAARGMPLVERGAALRWIAARTSGHAGGWSKFMRGRDGLQARAQRLLDGSPKAEKVISKSQSEPATEDIRRFFFERGQTSTADSLCASVRTSLIPLIVAAELPGVTSKDGEFRARLGLAALIDYLMVGWCEELLSVAELPPIDFKALFGPAAKPARVWFEALQAHWQSQPEEENANLWPPGFACEWPGDDIPMPETASKAKPKAARGHKHS